MARNIYKIDNERVPSATTILGLLNKPALVFWANQMGLDGINTRNYVDDKAQIGTLTHKMVECYCNGEEIDYTNYEFDQFETAEIAYAKWETFIFQQKFKPIENETMLVSDAYRFGGQIDIYAELNGKKALIDIKTCKSVHFEQFLQLSAYHHLLKESGREVETIMICRIGRDKDEGFEIKEITLEQSKKLFEIFLSLLSIYNLKKHDLVKPLLYKPKQKS